MNLQLLIASILAAIGVGIGALGSHSMPGYLAAKGFDETKIEKRLEQCEAGVRYQLIHSLAVVAISLSSAARERRGFRIVSWFMIGGIVLFSGGIYGIVFCEAPTHVIVPFGGLSFIAGWLTLAIVAFRSAKDA